MRLQSLTICFAYEVAILFGAVCPERGAGAALVVPACNTEAMQLHLDEIARKSPPAHTPFSFSIKLDGTAPKTSRLPKASRSCRCRRVRRSCIKQRSLRSVGHGGAGSTGGIAQRLDHIEPFSAVWRP